MIGTTIEQNPQINSTKIKPFPLTDKKTQMYLNHSQFKQLDSLKTLISGNKIAQPHNRHIKDKEERAYLKSNEL
jgi:hypothetical protein